MPGLIRVGQPQFSDSDISEILTTIRSTLRSGWLTTGPVTGAFEEEFRKIVGTKYAIAVNSGTAALHTIVASQGLKRNDEVIVPANTFASTLAAVLLVGARPVLADCDLDTFNVSPETLENAITPDTKVAMVTHIAGNPCDMAGIQRICKGNGTSLVEDAAHALGASYRGKMCGSFGVANAFSFYPTKVMTSGEGGMISTNFRRVENFARLFRNVGRAKVGAGPIRILGNNYRMSDIHAAIGLNQIGHLAGFVRKRNYLARLYNEEFAKIDWIQIQKVARHSVSSYYAYIVRLLPKGPIQRDRLRLRLAEKGIETTVMFHPLHRQPFFKGIGQGSVKCPNAEKIGSQSIVLPMHSFMTEDDVEFIVRTVVDVSK